MGKIYDRLIELGDEFAPPFPKDALEQYDNYLIYSMGCVDITYQVRDPSDGAIVGESTIQQTSWIAYQRFSPRVPKVNFENIISQYS